VSRRGKVGATSAISAAWTPASTISSPRRRLVRGGIGGVAEAQIQSELRRRGFSTGWRRPKLIALTLASSEGFARWSLRPTRRSRRMDIVGRRPGQYDRRGFKKRPSNLTAHSNGDPRTPTPVPSPRWRRAGTYQKPRDPDRPLVCVDETSKQLIVRRAAIPAKPDASPDRLRIRAQWRRNIFMCCATGGLARSKVTDHHAPSTTAQVLKELVRLHFPNAKQSCWFKTISARKRRPRSMRLFPADRSAPPREAFEWHYTPKTELARHGRIRIGVLSSQCLSRRIPDKQKLKRRSPPGGTIATTITPRPTGNSRPATPAWGSRDSTPHLNDSGRLVRLSGDEPQRSRSAARAGISP